MRTRNEVLERLNATRAAVKAIWPVEPRLDASLSAAPDGPSASLDRPAHVAPDGSRRCAPDRRGRLRLSTAEAGDVRS
jgi:hypothetical protein